MNPLESVTTYRDQKATGPDRTLKVAPPPPVPTPAQAAGPPVDVEVDLEPTGEVDLTPLDHQPGTADPPAAMTPADDAAQRPWAVRGRKQVVQVYLPAPTRARLDGARERHGTLGKAAMAALRSAYQWLVDTHTPEPQEPVGPFPAPRATRRRLAVEDARMRQLLVDPAEAAGIETLADQLEMSLSELVTLAIDRFYGEGGSLPLEPSPATPIGSRVKTKG
jgi:hypothetical protein